MNNQVQKPIARTSINTIMNEDHSSLYVKVHATKFTGVVTEVLMTVTSSSSGDVFPVAVPMTLIPVDLSEDGPKEDILNASEFRRMVSIGILELLTVDEAERLLSTPEAIEERARLTANKLRRIRASRPTSGADHPDDMNFKAMLPPGTLQAAQPGDYDQTTAGVSLTVIDALNLTDVSEGQRLALLRNLVPTFTEEDRRYIRAQSNDAKIRDLVG